MTFIQQEKQHKHIKIHLSEAPVVGVAQDFKTEGLEKQKQTNRWIPGSIALAKGAAI